MRPVFSISIGGADQTARFKDRLLKLEVSDRPGFKTDSLTVELDDRGGLIELPRKGAELAVTLGYEGGSAAYQGLFVVDEVWLRSPPMTMAIVGKAANMRATLKTGKSRCWADTTLGDLVKTIAGQHGYEAKVSDQLASIQVTQIDQNRESDMHLLTRIARQHDAVAKVADGKLIVTPKGEGKSASGKALPTISIPVADLGDYSVKLQDRSKYQAVEARWHDLGSAEQKNVKAGSGEPVKMLRDIYPNEAEAKSAAAAQLKVLERGTGEFDAAMPGRPEISAECKVVFTGARGGLDGEWLVTEAVHTLDKGGGFTTRISGERPKK